MPFKNYHAFRMEEPSKYKIFRVKTISAKPKINAIIGIRKTDGKSEIQAYRFYAPDWTLKEAKKWMKEKKLKAILIEPAISSTKKLEKNKMITIKKIKFEKLLKEYMLKLDAEDIHYEHEIKVFPKKKCFIEKYHSFINFNDLFFDELIRNFKNEKLSKPFFDLNHKEEESVGDILDLIKKEDGLYASIMLNEKGYKLIKNKEYKYISPTVMSKCDLDGEKYHKVLTSITLTNIPALEGSLPTLQEQLQFSKKQNMFFNIKNLLKDGNMNFKEKLSKISDNFKSLKLENGESMSIDPESLNSLLGMANDMVKAIEDLQSEKKVIEDKVEEMETSLQKVTDEKMELEKKEKENLKEEYFRLVLEKGKVNMKELEILKKQYDVNPEFVKELIDLREEKVDDFVQLTKQNNEKINISEEIKSYLEYSGLSITKENIEMFNKMNEERK